MHVAPDPPAAFHTDRVWMKDPLPADRARGPLPRRSVPGLLRSGLVRYRLLPPSVSPPTSVRRQDVRPKHTHSEAPRGHQPVEKRPDPDGA